MCDVELPNPGKFPYPIFLHGFIHNLILGRPYPEKYPYPEKDSITQVYIFFWNQQ